MRIGIDIDDTITNSYTMVMQKLGKHYNLNSYLLIEKGFKYEDITTHEKRFPNYFNFTREVIEPEIPNVSIKHGAREIIKKLKEEGNEIIIITARNKEEYNDPLNMTIKYLQDNNIYYDELHIGIMNKGKFCKENNIDILIDDNISHCLSAKDNDIKHLLIDNTFNRDNQELNRVYGWYDIYDQLNIIKNEQMQEC